VTLKGGMVYHRFERTSPTTWHCGDEKFAINAWTHQNIPFGVSKTTFLLAKFQLQLFFLLK